MKKVFIAVFLGFYCLNICSMHQFPPSLNSDTDASPLAKRFKYEDSDQLPFELILSSLSTVSSRLSALEEQMQLLNRQSITPASNDEALPLTSSADQPGAVMPEPTMESLSSLSKAKARPRFLFSRLRILANAIADNPSQASSHTPEFTKIIELLEQQLQKRDIIFKEVECCGTIYTTKKGHQGHRKRKHGVDFSPSKPTPPCQPTMPSSSGQELPPQLLPYESSTEFLPYTSKTSNAQLQPAWSRNYLINSGTGWLNSF